MDVDARLRLLEDREEIRELLVTYAAQLDAGDYAAYSELFAHEGELVARLGSATGPAAIRALLERTLGEGPRPTAFHLLANPVVEVEGDRASARTLWAYVTADDEGYPTILQLGHYDDALVREHGRWRFLRRDISRDLGYPPYEEHPRSRGGAAGRLRVLEDREQIWELFMDYRRSLDRRDFAAYSQLFAEDGEWIGNLGRATGPAAIKEMLDRTLGEFFAVESGADFHLVANPAIVVDGDRATAESTWCFVTRGEDGDPVFAMIGHYDDVLVRVGGRWRFQTRVAHSDIPFRELAPE